MNIIRTIFFPIIVCILPIATKADLQNGNFEAGLAGWTGNAGVFVGQDIPAQEGSNICHLGINNISGSILSQSFSVSGPTNLLTFYIVALGNPGLTGIVQMKIFSASSNLVSQMFTNAAGNTIPFLYQFKSILFVAPPGVTNLTLSFEDFSPNNGTAVDPILDDVRVIEALPIIIIQPASKNAVVGDSVPFSVTATGAPTLKYQWRFNGNTLNGVTDSSFTLINVQTNQGGDYSVVVTNSYGSVTSINASLTFIVPVAITSHPQSQSVLVGTNVTFDVTATGDPSLFFQWRKNGVDLPGATNVSLIISNVQPADGGNYSVNVSNSVSSVVSSNALLSVITLPIIGNQPQSVTALQGSGVLFSVGLQAALPSVSSGNLRLWLKADAGVINGASNRVVEWRDQSSRTNHASQTNVNKQPLLIGGVFNNQPGIRFDGLQDTNNGDFMRGAGDVGLTAAFTSFMVYSRANRNGLLETPVLVGLPGSVNSARSYYITNTQMAFSGWSNDYSSGFIIPASTTRIWTERLNTNKTAIEFFDSNGTNNFTTNRTASGLTTPGSGYYVGGLSSLLRNFQGDIAEIIYYQGFLNDSERQSVETYLKEKYFSSAGNNGISYQWRFNNVDIAGATNSVLALSNIQPTNGGNYSVVLSNLAGTVTSSNALLTVTVPPSITTQPQTQSVNAGSTATFTVVAAGTPPFSYQWQKNTVALNNATNSSLVLPDLAPSDAGSYNVIVTSPYGFVTSSNASLTVNVSTVRALNVNTFSATDFLLPIELVALGNENLVSFSLVFDPAILNFQGVLSGSGAAGATLIINTNQISAGRLGLSVAFSGDETFQTGTQQVLQVAFKISPITNSAMTTINFGDQPTYREISDIFVDTLWSYFLSGTVSISAVDFEGDVAPRNNGNRILSATDWLQVGRFAAGLDTIGTPTEFQRVDCAPRATLGNGSITIIDWVQAGRYAFGVDPITPVGGPTLPVAPSPNISASPRSVNLETTQTGQTNIVSVKVTAQGNENALGFSLVFNTNLLNLTSAIIGNNASGAILNVNTNQPGTVGLVLALSTGNKFSAGAQELVKLTFVKTPSASGSTTLAFTDTPVLREISDIAANSLTAAYSESLVFNFALPELSIIQSGQNVLLSWPASSSGFMLQSVPSLGTNWSTITTNLATNGQTISASFPATEQQQFFRLRQP